MGKRFVQPAPHRIQRSLELRHLLGVRPRAQRVDDRARARERLRRLAPRAAHQHCHTHPRRDVPQQVVRRTRHVLLQQATCGGFGVVFVAEVLHEGARAVGARAPLHSCGDDGGLHLAAREALGAAAELPQLCHELRIAQARHLPSTSLLCFPGDIQNGGTP